LAVKISISITQNSQDIVDNTSSITCKVVGKWTNKSYSTIKKSGWLKIDGTEYEFSSKINTGKTTSGSAVLYSKTRTVSHNSSTGKKTVSCSASYAFGGSSGTVTATASKTLTTIPRASTVSCPATFTAGTMGTVKITRKHSSFLHTVTNTLGSTKVVGTEYDFYPEYELFNNYPTSTKRSGSIAVQTVYGGEKIGSVVKKSFNVVLPQNDRTKPTCRFSAKLSEYGTNYASRFGVLIAGKSRLRTTCTFQGKYGATIASHYFSMTGTSASKTSNNEVITGYLSASSSRQGLNYYVKDSRGFTSMTAVAINSYPVVSYTVPSIRVFSTKRTNDNLIECKITHDVNRISLSSNFPSNKGIINIYLLVTDDSGNNTRRLIETIDVDASSAKTIVKNIKNPLSEDGSFSLEESYNFEATITDEITTNEPAVGDGILSSVLAAKTLMSFYGDSGITIGSTATEPGFNVNMPAKFSEAVGGGLGNGNFILYPEGGQLVSRSSSSPGYIKITLPQSWTNTMMHFKVSIFDYATNSSREYELAGYNYSTSSAWTRTTARSLVKSLLPVYFGHDGSRCAIYIGNSNTTWGYPQIQVHDLFVGYSNCEYEKWSKGWEVSITSELGTITSTHTDANLQGLRKIMGLGDDAGALSIANGGTGRDTSGFPAGAIIARSTSANNFSYWNAVPIERGGTDSTTVEGARSKLGVSASSHTHARLNNTNGGILEFILAVADDNIYAFRPDSTSYEVNFGHSSYRIRNIYTKNALNVSSDLRLKENFDTDFDKYIEMIDLITPTSYHRIDETGDSRKRHTGYIAQSVYKAMQEVGLGKEDFAGFSMEMQEDGTVYTYGLVYEEFIPILHAKLNKLEARINEQDTVIEDQSKSIEKQAETINQLIERVAKLEETA